MIQNGITIHALLEKDQESKETKKLQKKHVKHEKKLSPYPTGDGKTVFYCESPEKAKVTIEKFNNRQNNYKQI